MSSSNLRASMLVSIVLLATSARAAFINYSTREINVKVVYYGLGDAGALENLEYVYEKTSPDAKGKLIALTTSTADKTVLFDFLPLGLGEIRGFKVRFHLYTVAGKAQESASRVLVLKGVDGVVFVADSDASRLPATVADWAALKRDLAASGYDRDKMPLVVQLTHRERPGALPVDQLRAALQLEREPSFEAQVPTGIGVFDTLKGIAKLILMELKRDAAAHATHAK